jgi:ppGpp synthetase/RelA/SpoT-type nucleotidyltranferase
MALTRSQVDKAGRTISHLLKAPQTVSVEDITPAMDVADEYRATFREPMNAAAMWLRSMTKAEGCIEPVVSQRLKERRSVLRKLPGSSLWKMQDLGGCRAVLQDIDEVRRVQARIQTRQTDAKVSDYIDHPQVSGYRGVHVVTKYGGGSSSYPERSIEIQLRTQLMHQWAITIERLSDATGLDLKHNREPTEILDYMALVSQVFDAAEKVSTVPDDLKGKVNAAEATFKEYMRRHHGIAL